MKNTSCFIALFVYCLCCQLGIASEANATHHDSVIEVTIVKARHVADVAPRYAGDVPMGSYFDVTVSKPRAIIGEVPTGLKALRLMASHLHYFKRGKRISVYLRRGNDNSVLAVSWADVRSVACFDRDVGAIGSIAEPWHYTETTVNMGTRHCVYVD